MNLFTRIKLYYTRRENPGFGALDILKYIGPGLLVTVGFIDPGNWASNLSAGSQYGYALLWMVTLSTLMLIFLQHNSAHLGIATGLCLSEAATEHMRPRVSRLFLASAMAATVSTALAEILGAAIGLNMITGIPIGAGALLTTGLVIYLVFSNNYRRIEKYIIGFVSLIGISFIFEMSIIHIHWGEAVRGWFVPSFPGGSIPVIMSVLGAVVMPHNIYLHSEIIQSRQWNLEDKDVIKKQLKYEMTDTIFAMIVGWMINSAMIIVAASAFYHNHVQVNELQQAQLTLKPLLGNASSLVFAVALLLAGFSSSITASMAGGSIFAGIFREPFNIADRHSRTGVLITLIAGLLIIFMLKNPFTGLIWSQIILSIQLPWTVFGLLYLTSSRKVMGEFSNTVSDRIILYFIAMVVSALNIMLLWSFVF
ncbi:MAG TPA: Nramp family divalent metal transporter [Spirochaetota bacterium]|nr:Nramp family divalent metal transporter [Spirochaetota bacterium]